MHSAFENVVIEGLIRPGQMYLLGASGSRMVDAGPIDFICLIQRDVEILGALDMQTCIVMEQYYDLRAFIGWRALDEDVYEFQMLCYFKDEEKVGVYSVYLHRITPFEEQLKKVQETFGQV